MNKICANLLSVKGGLYIGALLFTLLMIKLTWFTEMHMYDVQCQASAFYLSKQPTEEIQHGDMLLHLVEQDCCALTQDQGLHLPPAANQSIGPLVVGPPRVVEGHGLLRSSLHFYDVGQVKLGHVELALDLHLTLQEVEVIWSD